MTRFLKPNVAELERKININSKLYLEPLKTNDIPFLNENFKIRFYNYFIQGDILCSKTKFNDIPILLLSNLHWLDSFVLDIFSKFTLQACKSNEKVYFGVRIENKLLAIPIVGYYFDRSHNLTLHSSLDIETLYKAYKNDPILACEKLADLLSMDSRIDANIIFQDILAIYNKEIANADLL